MITRNQHVKVLLAAGARRAESGLSETSADSRHLMELFVTARGGGNDRRINVGGPRIDAII